jgi:hypothetical protein
MERVVAQASCLCVSSDSRQYAQAEQRETGASRKDAKTPRREGAVAGWKGKLPFCKLLIMCWLF